MFGNITSEIYATLLLYISLLVDVHIFCDVKISYDITALLTHGKNSDEVSLR